MNHSQQENIKVAFSFPEFDIERKKKKKKNSSLHKFHLEIQTVLEFSATLVKPIFEHNHPKFLNQL